VFGVSAEKQFEQRAVGRSDVRRDATRKLRRLCWLLPSIVVAVLAGRQRQALAAATIEWSDFSKAGSIYFAPTIGEQQKATFRAALAAARLRVAELYTPYAMHRSSSSQKARRREAHQKPSKTRVLCWCPETESNRRHEDFQALRRNVEVGGRTSGCGCSRAGCDVGCDTHRRKPARPRSAIEARLVGAPAQSAAKACEAPRGHQTFRVVSKRLAHWQRPTEPREHVSAFTKSAHATCAPITVCYEML
jgi:hypothetical protein